MTARKVGVGQDGQPWTIDWGTHAHTGVQGQTRSGKSNWSYISLLTAVAEGDIRIVGVDPSGILLGPFARAGKAAGVNDAIALGTADPRKYLEVMRACIAEMDARILQLTEHGRKDKFSRGEHPILLLVMEEWGGIKGSLTAWDLANPKEKIGSEFDSLWGRWLMEGAKALCHTLVLSQRFDASLLGGRERSQISRSISFASGAEGVKMLHPNAEKFEIEQIGIAAPGIALITEMGVPKNLSARSSTIEYGIWAEAVETRYKAFDAMRVQQKEEPDQ